MTLPAQAPRNPRPGRPPGGIHYGWVIVGILVVVQVIGSAISQSAGVMVAPLRDPHGPFGWGIGTIGAVIVVHRQYFGAGPTSTLYGWEMMGAMMGHAMATGLAGLVLYVTGSFPLVLALSMAFSLVGMLVILHLESSARVLIPHWEASLPPEAQSLPTHAVPLTRCPDKR